MLGADPLFVLVVTAGMLFMFGSAGYLTWFFLKKSKQTPKK